MSSEPACGRHGAEHARPETLEQASGVGGGTVRFVAQDASGQRYLWSLRWGPEGYSCRSTRLTESEAESLHAVLSQEDAGNSRASCDAFARADPSPRQASFTLEENARRFFAGNRDAHLRHWTSLMFEAIRATEPAA
jgi:hypothetical protein